ncbi:hypothetical protein BJ165DRAFT_1034099 [Panaeolus papilionaceus]|nr:hypothetical protein BJ165DRAFT_1034099 [Panaeolus papilionaceus]
MRPSDDSLPGPPVKEYHVFMHTPVLRYVTSHSINLSTMMTTLDGSILTAICSHPGQVSCFVLSPLHNTPLLHLNDYQELNSPGDIIENFSVSRYPRIACSQVAHTFDRGEVDVTDSIRAMVKRKESSSALIRCGFYLNSYVPRNHFFRCIRSRAFLEQALSNTDGHLNNFVCTTKRALFIAMYI